MFKKTTFISICKWVAMIATSIATALIVGHHDLNPQKACPCIPDVDREYADI